MGQVRFRWPLWAPMVAIAIAAILFVTLRPFWPGWVERYERWQKNRPVHAQLSRTAPLGVQGPTTLPTLASAITQATRGPSLPKGVPIFIDPQGLQDVGATLSSPIVVAGGEMPIRESLRAALRQVGLDFVVADGRVIVGNPAELPEGDR